jgi:hypothetical protein
MEDRRAATTIGFVDAARSAPFVFLATVQRAGASNVEALSSSIYSTAVVRVDATIASPHALGDIEGRELTVHLAASQQTKRGQRLLIAADSLIYGEQISVSEVSRLVPGRDYASIRERVLNSRLRADDERLIARLKDAVQVVYGRCDLIAPYHPEGEGADQEPLGEAPPSWRIADVHVWRSLKGHADAIARVLFPFPRTQKWAEVPLFLPAQEGIWLLHEIDTNALHRSARHPPPVTGAYECPDQRDFHSPSSLDRIRLLIQNLPTNQRG